MASPDGPFPDETLINTTPVCLAYAEQDGKVKKADE